ncbi:MAG: hypothetical protein WDO13_03035 [Verrucomicrobiota bacterium]
MTQKVNPQYSRPKSPSTTNMGNPSTPAATVRRSASIVSTGAYLPDRVLTNADLEKMVDTTDEWIVSRTGIPPAPHRRGRRVHQRHGCTRRAAGPRARRHRPAERRPHHRRHLHRRPPSSPPPPATSRARSARRAPPRSTCRPRAPAFLYALVTADQFIAAGIYKTVLVIGAEKLSSIVNWQDRNTCVLFGDGAGAVVLQAREGRRGLIAYDLGADGSQTNNPFHPVERLPHARHP